MITIIDLAPDRSVTFWLAKANLENLRNLERLYNWHDTCRFQSLRFHVIDGSIIGGAKAKFSLKPDPDFPVGN